MIAYGNWEIWVFANMPLSFLSEDFVPCFPRYSQQSDQIALHCARPTRAFLGRALREQEAQAVLLS